jgi:hypothetical protein
MKHLVQKSMKSIQPWRRYSFYFANQLEILYLKDVTFTHLGDFDV